MKIAITAKHILDGVRCSPFADPVALAFRDVLPNVRDVIVFTFSVSVDGMKYYPDKLSYQKVFNFIRDFDTGKTVLPIELDYFSEN